MSRRAVARVAVLLWIASGARWAASAPSASAMQTTICPATLAGDVMTFYFQGQVRTRWSHEPLVGLVRQGLITEAHRAFIRFDTSSLPKGAKIEKVVLGLQCSTASKNGRNRVEVRRLSQDPFRVVGSPSNPRGDPYVLYTLWQACGSGAAYCDYWGPLIKGGWQEVWLTGANSDLEQQAARGWFAVGLREVGEDDPAGGFVVEGLPKSPVLRVLWRMEPKLAEQARPSPPAAGAQAEANRLYEAGVALHQGKEYKAAAETFLRTLALDVDDELKARAYKLASEAYEWRWMFQTEDVRDLRRSIELARTGWRTFPAAEWGISCREALRGCLWYAAASDLRELMLSREQLGLSLVSAATREGARVEPGAEVTLWPVVRNSGTSAIERLTMVLKQEKGLGRVTAHASFGTAIPPGGQAESSNGWTISVNPDTPRTRFPVTWYAIDADCRTATGTFELQIGGRATVPAPAAPARPPTPPVRPTPTPAPSPDSSSGELTQAEAQRLIEAFYRATYARDGSARSLVSPAGFQFVSSDGLLHGVEYLGDTGPGSWLWRLGSVTNLTVTPVEAGVVKVGYDCGFSVKEQGKDWSVTRSRRMASWLRQEAGRWVFFTPSLDQIGLSSQDRAAILAAVETCQQEETVRVKFGNFRPLGTIVANYREDKYEPQVYVMVECTMYVDLRPGDYHDTQEWGRQEALRGYVGLVREPSGAWRVTLPRDWRQRGHEQKP